MHCGGQFTSSPACSSALGRHKDENPPRLTWQNGGTCCVLGNAAFFANQTTSVHSAASQRASQNLITSPEQYTCGSCHMTSVLFI